MENRAGLEEGEGPRGSGAVGAGQGAPRELQVARGLCCGVLGWGNPSGEHHWGKTKPWALFYLCEGHHEGGRDWIAKSI